MGMSDDYVKNCIKSMQNDDHTTFLLNLNLLEYHNYECKEMFIFRAFKILILTQMNKNEEICCDFNTMTYKEWKSEPVQFALKVHEAAETWALEELNNLLKGCDVKEFKNIISSIILEINKKIKQDGKKNSTICNDALKIRSLKNLM